MLSLRSLTRAALGLAFVVCANSAPAAFHLWNIRELYSNASGTVQYIEFFSSFGSQQFVGGQQITISNVGGSLSNSFTINVNLPSDTTGRSFLLGTAGLAAAGGPTPDYVIPNNFLFTAGGSISFFGSNSGSYNALPSNPTQSYNFPAGTFATATPQNFAGNIGSVPEPATWGLLALGGLGASILFRRRQS